MSSPLREQDRDQRANLRRQARGRAAGGDVLHPPKPKWSDRRVLIVATQIVIVVSGVVLWEVAANRGWVDTFFWSSPSEIKVAFQRLASSGRLWDDTLFTLRSAVLGFLLGTTAGAIAGLSLWWSRFVARV